MNAFGHTRFPMHKIAKDVVPFVIHAQNLNNTGKDHFFGGSPEDVYSHISEPFRQGTQVDVQPWGRINRFKKDIGYEFDFGMQDTRGRKAPIAGRAPMGRPDELRKHIKDAMRSIGRDIPDDVLDDFIRATEKVKPAWYYSPKIRQIGYLVGLATIGGLGIYAYNKNSKDTHGPS